MVAATLPDEPNTIISHPDTTFAGPVFDRTMSISDILQILKLLFDYYEQRYEKIDLRLKPFIYDGQPHGIIEYFLFNRGYTNSMMALANVINLRNIRTDDDIYALYSSKKRSHIKRAIKSGNYSINKECTVDPEIWKSINENLQQKYYAATTHTLNEINSLAHKHPSNIEIYTARNRQGIYATFGLIFKFKEVIHAQYLGLNS